MFSEAKTKAKKPVRRKRQGSHAAAGSKHPFAFVRLVLAAVLIFTWPGLLPGDLVGAHADEPSAIIEFEQGNPVFDGLAELGTPRNYLPLPEAVRAVCPLPASQGEGFQQTLPVPDEEENYEYFWYGYVAPRGAEDLHAAGLPVVYTIYYADGRQSYRVHGTYGGANEGFFACDEQGNVTAAVVEVPVTWRGKYNATEEGTYTFIAKVEGFDFEGEAPTAQIALYSQEALQAAEAASDSGCCGDTLAEGYCGDVDGCAHTGGLALHGPDAVPAGDVVYDTDGLDGAIACACPEGAHDPDNAECPGSAPFASFLDDEGAPALSLGGDGEGISIMPLGIGPNGNGANDRAQDNYMYTQSPTSGSSGYFSGQYGNTLPLPASWINYVNTIWHNKGVNRFDWTAPADTGSNLGWVWRGSNTANPTPEVADQTTGNVDTNPRRIPTNSGTATNAVYRVYSGEQLRWALINGGGATGSTNSTIELCANIDLNGNNWNWTAVDRSRNTDTGSIRITSAGNAHYTIYNMGCLVTGNTSTSVGLYN
ncbi:MAG: hypothetical protein LBB46_00835, partial [Coriobacteriaceae bacterium]|nr:hypothetical protein [Coriobacteriaceae bacterium]